MTAPEFRYSLFGLEIASELPLPELFEGNSDRSADVSISLGPIPLSGEFGPGAHAVDGGVLLVIDGAGRYFVADGRRIVVEPAEGAPERNVRLFLFGSTFGLLIHQRGLLPLHANAVEICGKAVAFTGKPGAGKSTLAAWFSDRGHRVIADDVSVIGFEAGLPVVYPGLPRLRLWQQVLEASGRNPSDFPLSFEGDTAYKRDVLLVREKVTSNPCDLGAIVQLQRTEPGLCRLSGAAAAESVIANTYRGTFVTLVNSAREHWTAAMRVVHSVPVFSGSVDFQLDRLDSSYEPLLQEIIAALQGAND